MRFDSARRTPRTFRPTCLSTPEESHSMMTSSMRASSTFWSTAGSEPFRFTSPILLAMPFLTAMSCIISFVVSATSVLSSLSSSSGSIFSVHGLQYRRDKATPHSVVGQHKRSHALDDRDRARHDGRVVPARDDQVHLLPLGH